MLFIAGAIAYIAFAIGLLVLVGRKLRRGLRRTMLRATIVALFFSLTLVGSHGGVMPFFALPILMTCAVGMCGYGRLEFILTLLLPMAVQFAIIVGISMLWYAAAKRDRERSIGIAGQPDRASSEGPARFSPLLQQALATFLIVVAAAALILWALRHVS